MVEVVKKSGERTVFSLEKLKSSLRQSGAGEHIVEEIAETINKESYNDISTKELFNRAFALLKKERADYGAKYKLKKAIYELGPTGFPFEKFVSSILYFSGYKVRTGVILQGECVSHEVDIVANKKDEYLIAECKFHGDDGRKCDIKIPLYIHARYMDILKFYQGFNSLETPKQGWVVTNTRFSADAQEYGNCVGLHLLSWDYPKGNGLKDRIDELGLYPITVSTLLSQREKQFLLSRDVVLCRQLLNDVFYLDHLGISEKRKQNILKEINYLCKKDKHE